MSAYELSSAGGSADFAAAVVNWLVQIVFDCQDPDAIIRFWGRALQYRNDLCYASDEEIVAFRAAYPQYEGHGRIDDRELRRPPVYIQRVPEAKSGANRLRLEIAVPAGSRADVAAELAGLGAVVHGDQFADVEGNEFSLREATGLAERKLASIVFDCLDPDRMVEFWSAATGFVPGEGRVDPVDIGLRYSDGAFVLDGRRYGHVTGMDAAPARGQLFDLSPGLAFRPTGQPKRRKNRLHLDINSTDAQADRERLVGLGASVLQWDSEHVMADPEGNEFCLSQSRLQD
jgi:catechol 2,3-dioxygenase-like lactoylglutathione lyase family enzyme